MVAFLAVAVLVFAANFFVVKAVLIERSTTVYPSPEPRVPQPPSSPHVAPKPLPPAPRRLETAALRATLERYRAAVRERIDANTESSSTEQLQAAAELQRAVGDFSGEARNIGSALDAERVSASITAYLADAAESIAAADDRRVAARHYRTLADDLYGLARQPLEDSRPIFGRVLAHQELRLYCEALDELRRIATTDDLQGVEENELRALHVLTANERAFRRSPGADWYVAQQRQFEQLTDVRGTVSHLSEELATFRARDLESGEDLVNSIPNVILGPVPRMTPPAPQTAQKTIDIPPIAAAVRPITTESVTYEEDHDKRTLIALISGSVIVLLLIVGVGTVISIERPVRRLLDATARIARGEAAVRVERGGIRELDTLAVAFNRMADELQQARAVTLEYQQGLEQKVAERTRELKHFAENDYLTRLPNRRQFFTTLNQALRNAGSSGRSVAVFFLDVDNFKYINDSLGHAFGDRVLLSLANRLKEAVQNAGIAARFGGDEFTVLLEDTGSVEDVRQVGERIVRAFQTALTIDGRELIVGVSVGVSIYPEHEQEAESLLKAADAALFRAKKLGRSQLAIYTPDLLEIVASNFTTEQGLRRAIERDEFELVFQPEVDCASFETRLVEALIRWRTNDGRLMSPADFLSIAEDAGLIVEISDWVLGRAVQTAAQWYHGSWPEVRVAVNISPRQLLDRGFSQRLQRLLRQAQLPPRCIELELTESVLQTGPTTLEALRQLQAQGVAIALDDFGTGYSSLSSLQQLPLSRVKLDRSLIADMDVNGRSHSMVRAIIGMCRQLGLEITAEGVERQEQFDLLASQGIYVQGYLLSAPVAEHELNETRARIVALGEELLLRSRTGTHAIVHDLASSRRSRMLKDR
jgi:diguanylate cyclase (GGDEF)-like protein